MSSTKMDLGLLRSFLAVHRAGSITAAAIVLGISQPAVTGQIRALEKQLGQRLFERLPRGVAPTSYAAELARQIAPHLDALQAVTAERLTTDDPYARPIHLAGPSELCEARVLPTLADLTAEGLKLRLSFGLTDDLLADLSKGRYDIVVATTRPHGRSVEAVALTDEEFVLVAAPSWAQRLDRERLRSAPAAALTQVPLVAYAEDLPVIRRYWRTMFGIRPKGIASVVVPDLRGVLSAVRSGCGISVLPRYLCAEALENGELTALLEPEVPPINTLYLAIRAGTEKLPHVAAVRRRLISGARHW